MKKILFISLILLCIAGYTQTYTLGNVYSKTLTFTSAQVKTLAATPQELVAAPGAGKLLVFHGAILYLYYAGTNAFTEAGDNLLVNYDNSTAIAASDVIECTGFIDQAASTITNAIPVIDAIDASADIVNKNLALYNNNAEFAGNAGGDNTLTIVIFYSVIDL